VRGTIGHRKARERQVLKLLTEQAQAVPQLVERMYVGVDERLWPAARMSVWAHLIDLERRGEVVAEREVWSIARHA
jgi:hypothetical protein